MQKSFSLVLLAAGLMVVSGVLSGNAEARDRNVRTTDRVESRMSAPDRVEHSSGHGVDIGFGVSSISPITFTAGTLGNVPGSFTVFLNLSNADTLQFLASIPSTTPEFQFAGAVIYKRSLVGNVDTGLHLGGGTGLGTNSKFAMTIFGTVGAHYTVPNTGFLLSVDGGPVLALQTGIADPLVVNGTTTKISFGMGAFSSVLGASVAYVF